MVKNFDLNYPVNVGGTSGSTNLFVDQGAGDATESTFESNKGLATSPIDVEAIEDDVELITPSAFFEGTNRSRRKRQIVDVEEVIEIPLRRSEVETVDTLLSLNSGNVAGKMPADIVNAEYLFFLEESSSTKRHRKSFEPETRAPPSPPPPPPPPPKEPTFSCPVCMSSLTDPCSTVCGHIFCQACIMAAIKARKQCPNCRRKLPSKKSFHRVYLPTTD